MFRFLARCVLRETTDGSKDCAVQHLQGSCVGVVLFTGGSAVLECAHCDSSGRGQGALLCFSSVLVRTSADGVEQALILFLEPLEPY